MNKITCKLTALLLTLTFLMSMACVSVSAEVITLSATETTRVNGSDYTSSTVSSTTVSGTNLILRNAAKNNTVTYTVNAPVAGYYRVAISASLDNVANSGLVDWQINGVPTSLGNANEKYSIGGLGASTGRTYDLGSMYLNQGENTITWSVTGISYGTSAAIAYIEFTKHPEKEIALSGATTIMGEEFTTANGTHTIYRLMDPYDGRRALTYTAANAVKDTSYATYKVTAPIAGYYDIGVQASWVSSSNVGWKIYANESTNTVSKYTDLGNASPKPTKFFIDTLRNFDCGKIYLKEGENTITWMLTQTGTLMGLEYITLTPPAVPTLSATETTRINGSEYTSSTVSSTTVSGTNLILKNAAKNNTVTYAVNAPVAGYYRVAISASLDNVANSGLVDWQINGVPTSLGNANEKYSIGGLGASTGRTYDLGSMYLNQGVNTITWSVSNTAYGTSAAIVYIEFTKHPEKEIAPSGTTTIMGEEFTTANGTHTIYRLMDPYDGRRALTYTATNATKDTSYATYKVTAPISGYYNIGVQASWVSSSNVGWKIYANEATNTVSKYTDLGNASPKPTKFFIDTLRNFDCGKIYLNQGENTIVWMLTQTGTLAGLEYITLTPPTVPTLSATETTRIEGEEYTGATVSPNVRTLNNPDDGQKAVNYASYNPTNYSGKEFIVEYLVNVEMAGNYSINAVASARSETFTSEWTIYTDKGSKVASYVKGDGVATSNFLSGVFFKYACGTIQLEKGLNTIYWKVNKDDVASGVLQAALDYIELTPPPIAKISSTASTRIEGEAATEIVGGGYKRDMKTDDGSYALTYSPNAPVAGQEYYATYVVNVELPGTYNINVVASKRSETYTTDWTIYANTADNAVSGYTKGADVTTNWFSGVFNEYNCGTITLKKGINTIYWKVNEADAASNQLQAALDYIELTPPPIVAISAVGTTRIEGENASEKVGGGYNRSMLNDGSRKALTYASVAATSGQEYYAAYYVNVEEAGHYKVNAVASIKGQTYTSDWTIYANTADNAVTGYTQGADVTTDWYANNFKEFSCGTIYLEKGLNTIYWKVDGNDASNGMLQAALDYIEFTSPVFQVPAVGTTRIEGEDASKISGGGGKRNMKTDDGAYALSYAEKVPESGQEYYAEFDINVEQAGYYKVNTVASIRGQTYTSDWTIYANTADNTVTGYTQGADVTTGWFSNIFKEFSCGTIYLNAGRNKLYWKVNEADAPSGKLQAALDYIELTSAVIRVSATETTKVEGEEYTSSTVTPNVRVMNDPDDGQRAVNYVSYTPENYDGKDFIIEFDMYVEQAGYYKLDAVASLREQEYTSDWFFYMNTEDNGFAYIQGEDVETTSFLKNLFKQYHCEKIYLNQGSNKLYWKVDKEDAPSGKLQAALDYFTLTPFVPQVIEIGDETAFEAETDMMGTVALGASNDRIVAGVSTKIANSISLNVLTTGNYMVEISGTAGKVSVAFDDNAAVTLADNEAIKIADGACFLEDKYPYGTYVLAESVGLTAGSHTITITVDGDEAGAAADYIKLTRMVEPTGISISAEDVLNIGDTTDITINGINIADMYMVTYSTSDDYVAIVDGNGKITATGAGTAYIDVVVRKYVISEGITLSLEVDVNTSNAIYVRNAQVNGGVFTADLTKVRALDDVAKAYITVYEKGVLKYINVVNIESGLGLQTISEEVPGATSGDVVEIFIWYSDLDPVCDPVCVRVK